ncbi:eukaryotic translation initiation factor 3 subunit m [Anaeramoeba flamelloides]|uniref:Eukaryotic translation initiation factor 3 subunit m n=1 Tax=Anaeramoeba flamelloides TaxID=1746091 RepID=A0ABQ8YG22_9EUKA|nr:eukaryotic translation initiation factor 3 subunit m [Anaeramoeba flamelloides]
MSDIAMISTPKIIGKLASVIDNRRSQISEKENTRTLTREIYSILSTKITKNVKKKKQKYEKRSRAFKALLQEENINLISGTEDFKNWFTLFFQVINYDKNTLSATTRKVADFIINDPKEKEKNQFDLLFSLFNCIKDEQGSIKFDILLKIVVFSQRGITPAKIFVKNCGQFEIFDEWFNNWGIEQDTRGKFYDEMVKTLHVANMDNEVIPFQISRLELVEITQNNRSKYMEMGKEILVDVFLNQRVQVFSKRFLSSKVINEFEGEEEYDYLYKLLHLLFDQKVQALIDFLENNKEKTEKYGFEKESLIRMKKLMFVSGLSGLFTYQSLLELLGISDEKDLESCLIDAKGKNLANVQINQLKKHVIIKGVDTKARGVVFDKKQIQELQEIEQKLNKWEDRLGEILEEVKLHAQEDQQSDESEEEY